MDVNTDDLSAFLNLAWQNAQDGANSLPAQLLAEQQNALALLAKGSVQSVGKNSTSQSYGYYGPGNLTHRQITNAFTTLIRYYQTVKDKIIGAFATARIDVPADFDFDQPIYDQLTKFFQVSEQAPRLPNIAELRYPTPCLTGGWPTGACA